MADIDRSPLADSVDVIVRRVAAVHGVNGAVMFVAKADDDLFISASGLTGQEIAHALADALLQVHRDYKIKIPHFGEPVDADHEGARHGGH